MVGSDVVKKTDFPVLVDPSDYLQEEIRWCSATLKEVLKRGSRLEASFFDIEGRHARDVLSRCKWPMVHICGDGGLSKAYHRPRFKRIWVDKSDLPIYQPSQITELNPKPSGYLSLLTNTDIDALRVHKGQILLTCSGTIGNCTIVNKTLDKRIFSHDVIRITSKKDINIGYIYAFFRTKIGQALIRTNEYGAVVSHIEPEHLENVPIPNPPYFLKKRIHDLIIRSYDLRDESNCLLDKAELLLYQELKLPPIEKLRIRYFDEVVDLRNYSVKLSQMKCRLDASYHIPIINSIIKRLKKEASEIIIISDPRITKRVILPGRFARVYVKEGQGSVYFTGKHILELDPSDKKYLSFARHAERIRKELTIRENMLLITSSGTLGKVVLVPRHWDGWTMTHDIIRLVFASTNVAGYVWVFLASTYGQELVRRYTYGSVVDHIEAEHIVKVPVPLLKSHKNQYEINMLALEAKEKRTEAYLAEQEAIRIINDQVLHVTK